MSYIYEALKRAEDENARGVAAAGRARRRRFFATPSRAWLWTLIGVLAANAAVIITLTLVRRSPEPTVTVAGQAVSPPPDAGVKALTPAAPAVQAARAPTASAPPSSNVETARPARPATAVKPAVQPAAPPVPAAARADSAPATPTAAAPETASARPETSAPVAPAIPPPATAPGAATPSPPAADASKLHVQVVVYSDVPAERMVIINGRRYAEGQKIDPETVVERITPEGAVVTRKGQSEMLISGR
jgi:general secretion pathway protein B